MSEISETEIKSMTKVENYIRGYRDGKSDVLDKIRAEIQTHYDSIPFNYDAYNDGSIDALEYALEVIDKYREGGCVNVSIRK